MLSRLLTLLVWALVAGSAVFWGARLLAQPAAVPAHATVAVLRVAPSGDLSRLFGAAPPPAAPVVVAAPPPPESSRFQLIGVVAARQAPRSQGLALIAVDGKMPRAYGVGAPIDGDLVLQSVQARGADIGPRGGAALVSLQLQPLPPPATGVPVSTQPGTGLAAGAPVPGAPVGVPAQRGPMVIQGQAPPLPTSAPPPQLAVPSVPPGGLQNLGNLNAARLRAFRNPSAQSGAMPMPGVAPVPEDTLPNEPATSPDGRNLR